MKEQAEIRNTLLLTGAALSATAALAALGRYVRGEIQRRGYPSWDVCRCDFKHKSTIYQVWFSRNERRGETIVMEERGMYLAHPAGWLRRFLHHSSQVIAALNPRGRYVEHVMLSPQEAHQFAVLLHTASMNEESGEEPTPQPGHIIWRREVLHVPRYPFDAYVQRLYPAHIPQERSEQAQPLPALWDPHNDLPLAGEGTLLETPTGTRIDYIGWTPSQISYCTARLKGAGLSS
jgi:hypothetical protein